jgi:hypothetical protein
MSKLLLPVLVGVFVGAFAVELVRRNNPELAAGLKARAKRLTGSRGNRTKPPRRLITNDEGDASWKHSG